MDVYDRKRLQVGHVGAYLKISGDVSRKFVNTSRVLNQNGVIQA